MRLIISLLTSFWLLEKIRDNMNASTKVNAFDMKIGIPYLLLSLELAIIAMLHLFAFPARQEEFWSEREHRFCRPGYSES
jgi:hypothetical protein